MGATFAVLFTALLIIGLFLLNKRYGWWVSSDLLKAETARADAARADAAVTKMDTKAEADQRIASIKESLERRILELREDAAARVLQVRADSQAEMDRLLRVIDAIQREVESWRQAFHLADQANREEDDARWAHIQSMLTTFERFITELQRQLADLHQQRALELGAGRDGPAGGGAQRVS
jgi:biopolymer transport protein ExbD